MKKGIIFDFDGTLVDTFDMSVRVYNDVWAEKLNTKKIQKSDYAKLRAMTILELLREYNIPRWRLWSVVRSIQQGIQSELEETKFIDGWDDYLRNLCDGDVRLAIVSSNTSENLQAAIAYNNAKGYFADVIAHKAVFGKEKTLRKYVQRFPDTEFIYIGDEVRDVVAAHKAGLKIAAVTWGFNNREALEKAGADWVVDSVEELRGSLLL